MVLVIVALSMTAIMAMVALVLDMGYARQEAEESQIAVDAAALAGAKVLPTSNGTGIAAALDYVVRDLARSSSPQTTTCRSPFPATVGTADGQQQTECYLIDNDYLEITAHYNGLNRMRVESSQVSPAFFGGVVDEQSTTVTRAAVAELDLGGTSECGLCVVGTGRPFNMQNGDLVVTGDAGVAVNGDGQTQSNGCLASQDGRLTMHSGGTASGNFANGTTCDGALTPLSPTSVPTTLDNPLEFLDDIEPSTLGTVKSGCGQGPGVYRSIPVNCDLQPGLYVITGATHISGFDEIRAPGVTLFLTCTGGCSPGQVGAEIVCSGQARISITAPTTSPGGGIPPGLAIWFDKDNAGALDCRGNGAGLYSGTIYGPSATLWNRGNGNCTIMTSLVVVGFVNSSGNPSSCAINYDATQNVQIPPDTPRLVE